MGATASVWGNVSPSCLILFFSSFLRIFFIFLSRTLLSSGLKSSSPWCAISSGQLGGSEICQNKAKQSLILVIYISRASRSHPYCEFITPFAAVNNTCVYTLMDFLRNIFFFFFFQSKRPMHFLGLDHFL